jgi:predicted metal-dependent phosphoesterase TrpH
MTETNGARFLAADLHTHTPASRDVQEKIYGAKTPAEVVSAALTAGLDAIAVTNHNTSAWCDKVAEAAAGTSLIVLPGVEISTTEATSSRFGKRELPAPRSTSCLSSSESKDQIREIR